MKKFLLAAVAVLVTAFSANAQVKIESPHPDLNIKITRCAYASGTVVIDMVVTNSGVEDTIEILASQLAMYDDEGNSYSRDNSKIEFGFPNKGLSNGGNFTFPQDIPLKFRIQMGSISADASKFSLMKVGLRSKKGAMSLSFDKPLIFRNLEWEK